MIARRSLAWRRPTRQWPHCAPPPLPPVSNTPGRSHRPPSTSPAVLRVIRVDADPSGARPPGEPPHALLSGGWVYPVTNSVVSLGRGLRNDVVLLDPAASREHARLVREADGWWIENISIANPL